MGIWKLIFYIARLVLPDKSFKIIATLLWVTKAIEDKITTETDVTHTQNISTLQGEILIMIIGNDLNDTYYSYNNS